MKLFQWISNLKIAKKLRVIKSLRTRLFLVLVLIGILPCIVFHITLLKSYENKEISNRSINILSQAKVLGTQILNNHYLTDLSNETISSQLDLLSNVYDGRVLLINSSFQIVRDTYNLDVGKTIISEEIVRSYKGEEISKYDSENHYIELALPLREDQTDQVLGVLLVSVSTENIAENYEYLNNNAFVIEVACSILILAISLFLSFRLVRPFGKITKSIDAIQTGEEVSELAVNDYTETEAISEAFNGMVRRMQVIDQSRQEFVSNVSHELKTPLTSMKVLADSLLDQPDVPAELYREFMTDIAAEIDRENKIINDLLSLVKMDRSAGVLNIESLNINELLELILKRLRPIAEKQKVELVLESFRPVTAEVDEVKLTLAVTNLIENAIKYNKEEGWVHVSLNADHKNFFLRVEDCGIGIPEESLEHIYDRFYRVDKSHSREIGGTGLGLSITRNVILMHRGAIKVHSKLGEGTVFTVRIPINYIA